ncbi:hypothetical protein D3C77_320520 [compost metagenome]
MLLQLGDLLLQRLDRGLQALDARRNLGGLDLEALGQLAGDVGLIQQEAAGRIAGQGLDAAHAGGHAAFRDDLEQGDVAGAEDVGAAAQFDRIGARTIERVAQGQDADLVAVLLAEQSHGARRDGGVRRHQFGRGRHVLADDRVHLVLDAGDLLVRQRGVVAEVEAHALGVDHLTLLGDVGAEHVLDGGVEQVGGRVVGAGGRARALLDRGGHDRARGQRPLRHL